MALSIHDPFVDSGFAATRGLARFRSLQEESSKE
jgi:hypothetical protein